MLATKHLKIAGCVQGVGFRQFMTRTARELGVTGWVRNRIDGGVEAMIQGSPEAVEAMIARARRGPQRARVAGFEVSEAHGSFERFDMLPTA